MTPADDLPALPEPAWKPTEIAYYVADQMRWYALAARAEQAAEVERLRVQLAGCSIAANSNTEESQLANTIPIDSYGYSASYGDCLRASLRELVERQRAEAAEARMKEFEADAFKWYQTEQHLANPSNSAFTALALQVQNERDTLRTRVAELEEACAMKNRIIRNLDPEASGLREKLETAEARVAELEEKLMVMCVAQINGAEPAVEPVDSGLDERQYRLVADAEIEFSVPDGYERETLKAGTCVWLARWTDD